MRRDKGSLEADPLSFVATPTSRARFSWCDVSTYLVVKQFAYKPGILYSWSFSSVEPVVLKVTYEVRVQPVFSWPAPFCLNSSWSSLCINPVFYLLLLFCLDRPNVSAKARAFWW